MPVGAHTCDYFLLAHRFDGRTRSSRVIAVFRPVKAIWLFFKVLYCLTGGSWIKMRSKDTQRVVTGGHTVSQPLCAYRIIHQRKTRNTFFLKRDKVTSFLYVGACDIFSYRRRRCCSRNPPVHPIKTNK